MLVTSLHLSRPAVAPPIVDCPSSNFKRNLLTSGALVHQELGHRGLALSEQELDTYVQRQRSSCLGASESLCRAAIVEMGLDPHDEMYWKLTRPILRRDLERARLDAVLVKEMGLEGIGADEATAVLDSFYRRLEEDAEIVWHDVGLKRDYEKK